MLQNYQDHLSKVQEYLNAMGKNNLNTRMVQEYLDMVVSYLLFGDDAVAILVEDHERELQLIVFTSTGEVCERYHELSHIDLSRTVGVEQLEQPFALRRGIHL